MLSHSGCDVRRGKSRAVLTFVDSALVCEMLDSCQKTGLKLGLKLTLIPTPTPTPSRRAAAAAARPRTPRERARAQTVADIVRLGREHLALHGAAALSLRAVARDLGVVSSAVYRYVESREELLTLLLIDAYNELGDEVDAAVGAVPEAISAAALRRWAARCGTGRCANPPATPCFSAARCPATRRRPSGPPAPAPG